MSDFLGRVGRITEWVVVSNLENRAVNAACDKAQDWWKNRKQNKHDSHDKSVDPTPLPPPSQIQSPPSFPPYQTQQASYMPPPPATSSYPPPSMGCNQLLVTVNNVEGLNQWGPLVVIIECNHQRHQTSLGQYQQQFSLPIYQFDYDQLFIWIQTEYQQQTIANAQIPIRILLNDNNNWSSQPQQRWIPLRDQFNGPAGQVLVNVEYRAAYPSAQHMPGPSPPPPYSYYP